MSAVLSCVTLLKSCRGGSVRWLQFMMSLLMAGVSPKTVSRVINGDAPVSDKTRSKVETAIAALGYIPSSAARIMRSHRSGLVGLITGAISRTGESTGGHGMPDMFLI